MKKTTLTATLALALLAAAPVKAQTYQLVWSDEFDSNTLGTNWNVEVVSNPSNSELQYYTNRSSNVRIENGNLLLVGRRESYGGRSFTSGRVNSDDRVNFTHGKVEARIKLPYTSQGLWPAFWMMGDDIGSVGWPACGELDILEAGHSGGYGGNENRFYNGALHWGPAWNQHMQYATNNSDGYTIIDGDYHLFTCEWTENQVRCYVDNRSNSPYYVADIGSGTSPYAYFHKPFFILFNLAIGGEFPGITDPSKISALPYDGSEAIMYVDYVRVYQTVNNVVYRENDKDKVDGSGGGSTPDPDPVTVPAAPTPDKAQANVKSLYSDKYTQAAPGLFVGAWNQSTVTEEVQLAAGDKAYKCSSFNYLGFQFGGDNDYVDVSDMDYVHLDIYPLNSFTINFYPIVKNANGSTLDTQSAAIVLTANQWNSVDLPLSQFTNLDTQFQVKFDGGSGQTFYLDNLYYWKGQGSSGAMGPAPTPTKPQSDVAAIYSNKYSCPTLTVPSWAWTYNPATAESVTLASGDQALHLTNYSFLCYDLSTAIDASAMTYFHIDVYPVDLDEITVHLNGDQAVFVSRQLTRNKWNSLEIPMTAFTGQGQNVSNITGIKLTGTGGADADGSKQLYVDNLYFYKGAVNSIAGMQADTASPSAAVYTIDGRLVSPAATSVEGLPKGVYIRNGKKVVVR